MLGKARMLHQEMCDAVRSGAHRQQAHLDHASLVLSDARHTLRFVFCS